MDGTMNGSGMGRKKRPWLSWAMVLLFMGLALILRWRYIREISLSVDEFNTIWAARHVPVRGLPSFPSGNIYPHGFVFTYLTVPFVLGKMNESAARLPGLLISLAAIPVAYGVGRRFFDGRVGLITAAALAVDPACIVWGGRARMYGLLQLLTLLIVYLYYRGLAEDRARDRTLAMGLVVVAIFTHAEAGLLLPALGLATLVAWPWSRLWRRDVILPFVLAGLGAGAFFLLSKYGQQEHLKIIQESRPYLDLNSNLLGGPQAFAPFFFDLHRLPFSLLTIGGIVFLFRPRFERLAPQTYLYVILGATLLPILILAGATWRNARYLFLLLPFLFFLGGAALVRLLDLVPALRRNRRWQPMILALLTAFYIGLSGSPQAYRQELGYDLAFRTLSRWRQPQAGDRVISVAPSACAVYLGRCDYFAIQHGYKEFVVRRPGDGAAVDLWSAAPVLTETASLVNLLSTAPRVWFVTDKWRFQTRYDADFIQTVLDQMEPVYDERGVLIFRADGYRPPPPPPFWREREADFDEALRLTGFGLSATQPSPGQEIEITLGWQALAQAEPEYTVALHLVTPDATGVTGGGIAGLDEPLLGGFYQPTLWPEGRTMTDRHRLALPADLPPGRYRLDLGLYPSDQPGALLPVAGWDRLLLAALTVGDLPALPPPAHPTDFTFGDSASGDQFRLLGYNLQPATCNPQPATCNLSLYWQALAPADRDYTVFVHLLGPQGSIVAQDDAPPGDPFFPTTTWLPGDVVLDEHTLSLPADAPPGEYTLRVGLYHQPSGERLGEAAVLTTFSLPESP
ncbi:MAG TPA: hypothetical protein ENJ31_04785 [Anaerolineae bacterium]|nr:hypothetical protein [Anaerolineae bacterium]